MSRTLIFTLLSIGLIVLFLVGMSMGAVSIDLMRILSGAASVTDQIIFFELRLPRLAMNIIIGAGVALSGAAIQGLFRNALADPALIGVSSGAAVFAAAFLVFGVQEPALRLAGVSGSAFLGSIVATTLVLLVAKKSHSTSTILLAGIAVNAIALSAVGLLSYLSTDAQLRSVSFWALGSFNGVTWTMVGVAGLSIPAMILIYFESSRLNIITLGDREATGLGVSVRQLRLRVIVGCAFIVAVGVSQVGVISFIGLVVPHLVRLTIGSNHKVLLPASAIGGGAIMIVADSLCRTLFVPNELPVGILTALVGGPFFIYLIIIQKNRFRI